MSNFLPSSPQAFLLRISAFGFEDKVQENRNSLSKLSNVQNTILKQVNALNMAPGTVVGPVASSPPWANQILDQGESPFSARVGLSAFLLNLAPLCSTVRKQKAESAKQLAHLEEAVRSLQLSTGVSSGLITTRSPESPTIGPENRQLADQIRGVIRSELHNLFQSSKIIFQKFSLKCYIFRFINSHFKLFSFYLLDTPKIVDPLIKNLRGNLERLLSPLPQSVADRMLTIIKEPVSNFP